MRLLRTLRRHPLWERTPGVSILLTIITALPPILGYRLWARVWHGGPPNSWDGVGHYGIAQIYTESIFPDTFGWTNSYFCGMPFPNFYPPVFYWCVALLHHTHVLSFDTAFKCVVGLPVLLTPPLMWLLGWKLSRHSRLVATAVGLATVLLLVDTRFMAALPAGLDYFSTFQIGLYTQSLGFLLLISWYVLYCSPRWGRLKFAAATLLLALTVLANFFNAVTTTIFIAATLIYDVALYYRAAGTGQQREVRRAFLARLFSPLVAACLTLFWLVPMISEYEYFVTRPYIIEAGQLISFGLWVWYALALVGGLLWLRQPTSATWPYLMTCLTLAVAVLCAATIAPRWFPLQSPRFLATLNFILAMPVGQALAAGFRGLARILGDISTTGQQLTLRNVRFTATMTIVLLLLFALGMSKPPWDYSFYLPESKGSIDEILGFARQHRDGRYMVEVTNPKLSKDWATNSFDARAINSYLGAQGNETLGGIFREASPQSLFSLPAVDALSDHHDSFGISSMLADDLDFAGQPLRRHVERARLLGLRYMVIRTPAIKERVAREIPVGARYDFGDWTIFELPGGPAARLSVLPYKPALVMSSFTVKSRRRNEMSFIRLAEEQFADNWFDVLLVRSPEPKIDRLGNLANFGALILDTYDYDDETVAFERLREFAQHGVLILLASESDLFKRISAAPSDFPLLRIVERSAMEPGEALEATEPTCPYQDSPLRQQWAAVRRALENNKAATNIPQTAITYEFKPSGLTINSNSEYHQSGIPVLINTTFHPNWRRSDGGAIYAATPFYTLTFIHQPAHLNFERRWYDFIALWASAATLITLCLYACGEPA
ncbi:MAG: hypothetical protein WCF57_22825 [Pyrinomonadaceae bacterium]